MLAPAGCGGGEDATRGSVQSPPSTLPAGLLHLYDYDTSAPFDVKDAGVQEKEGATVHDITYAGPNGRITAFLVVPDGDGPFPAVLFMPGAPGARYTFYSEALDVAQRGILSLLPDPPYSRPPIEDVVSFTPSDVDGIVQEVKAMRRPIDLSFPTTTWIRAGSATSASAGAVPWEPSSPASSGASAPSSSRPVPRLSLDMPPEPAEAEEVAAAASSPKKVES